MKDQINTIRSELTSLHGIVGDLSEALDALAQLEAMVGEQEPVAFVNGAALSRLKNGESVPAYNCWGSPWPTPLYAAPVAQQPQADTCQMCGDKPHPGCNSEFQGDKACRFWPAPDSSYRDDHYWRGWNAAIRSQQPQAEPDIHEAQGQIEFLDKKNNALSAAIRKVMARLADLLDEDQFKEIEDAISSAGVQPQAEAVPAVQIVNCHTCKHSGKSCDDYPCRNCGVEFGDGPFNRWEAPQQAEKPLAALQPTTSYVQPVPDHCDRIVWRNNYYHLPLKQPQAEAVPPGYVLVPVEPTAGMCKAAADAWLDCGSRLVLNKAGAAVRAAIAQQKGQKP